MNSIASQAGKLRVTTTREVHTLAYNRLVPSPFTPRKTNGVWQFDQPHAVPEAEAGNNLWPPKT